MTRARGHPFHPVQTSAALVLAVGVALTVVLMVLTARPAHALVTGGCTATAEGSVSGHIDLTTATVWHLRNEDIVTGAGTTPAGNQLTGVNVRVDLFGLPIPIISNNSTGRGGSAGPYTVSNYSRIARIVGASGEAGNGTCKGTITIVVDNVSPLASVAGGGGTALGVLGLLGILLSALGRGGIGGRIGGALAGLLSGAGFGLLLQQIGTLDPTSLVGLAIPGIGLVIGALVAGILRR